MKKSLVICLLAVAFAGQLQAQKYFTRDGNITFSASTPLETIDATNRGASAVVDASSGAMEFAVLIKGFIFEKALMQEHFNENYLESGKYPKATFKGKIQNIGDVKWSKDGSYPVKFKGTMTIHGTSKEIAGQGTITVKGGRIVASSSVDLPLSDYAISIPSVVADKISKTAKVQIEVALAELKR
ncbi:MAG: YceI family protein [Saprospiraceae bacterium]|nr:YceI family protein [Saprospiraceae bacterium]